MSSGVSASPPSHWQPNHTAPLPSCTRWRIDSLWMSAALHVLADEPPGRAVDEGERGLHARQVQLLAPGLDVRLDPAVGDGQRLAVGEQDRLVRTDAIGRELADALVAAGGVVDADEAGARLVVVLRGVEQPAVARERAVAVEVPVGRRREQHRLARDRRCRRRARTSRGGAQTPPPGRWRGRARCRGRGLRAAARAGPCRRATARRPNSCRRDGGRRRRDRPAQRPYPHPRRARRQTRSTRSPPRGSAWCRSGNAAGQSPSSSLNPICSPAAGANSRPTSLRMPST